MLDISTFFTTIKNVFIQTLADVLAKHLSVKANCELFCEYMKRNDAEDEILISVKSFQTKMSIIQQSSDFEIFWKNALDKIQSKMQEFQEKDSGWALVRIIHLELNVNSYQPLQGSGYIPLPNKIKKKKACVNIINQDNYCFKWAIISALYPVSIHTEKTSSYGISDIANEFIMLKNDVCISFKGLSFPMKINDIKMFEEMNPTISVNVFGYNELTGNIVGPYYCTQSEKAQHINLLFLTESENNASHYVWIKHISR